MRLSHYFVVHRVLIVRAITIVVAIDKPINETVSTAIFWEQLFRRYRCACIVDWLLDCAVTFDHGLILISC